MSFSNRFSVLNNLVRYRNLKRNYILVPPLSLMLYTEALKYYRLNTIFIMDVTTWSSTEVEQFLITKGFSEDITKVLKGKR